MLRIFADVVDVFVLVVIVWAVLSWIPVDSSSPVAQIKNGLDRMINPIFAPLRRVIPPIQVGGSAIDITPLVFLFILTLLLNLL